MNVRTGDIDRMWEKLGFEVDSSGHHVTATLRVEGRVEIRTYRSHGSGKMSGNIPHFIRGQMKLNPRDFADAVNCPLKAKGYLAILKAKGLLS